MTNEPAANDTYADGNNDIDSWMKSMSLFVETPTRIKSGQPIPITGMAQVGVSGLSKVQVWISPVDKKWPKEDPYFTKAPWKEASILPPPKNGEVNYPQESFLKVCDSLTKTAYRNIGQ